MFFEIAPFFFDFNFLKLEKRSVECHLFRTFADCML